MGNQPRRGGNRLSALLAGLHDRVVDRVRRHARSRAGERSLALLDDRTLRDIGLTRSQAHAAAYGLLKLGRHSPADSTRASEPRTTPAPHAERAARG